VIDQRTARIWDRQSRSYDLFTAGQERRWAPWKRELFAKIVGRTLLAAAGTGHDLPFLPPGHQVVAIDISAGMLRRAEPRAARYDGAIELVQADVTDLPFPDAAFDTALTSCTFCSVPDPVAGLRELCRVVRPGGRLLMFEHTDSRHWAVHPLLSIMTFVSRHVARATTELTRDTVGNVRLAGFIVERVTHLYLDVVKTIEATRPA
jgi:ubiquinone/menaquinone biosynthesis C-methylase UbiE